MFTYRRVTMKKVLIIDDEPDILQLVRDILKNKYEVFTSQSAEEAISFLENNPVDLIILDIMMPRIDGWDFLWIIKGSETLRNTPVIVLTARADAEDKLIGLKEGIKHYITKPFLPDELTSKIKEIIGE